MLNLIKRTIRPAGTIATSRRKINAQKRGKLTSDKDEANEEKNKSRGGHY